MVVGCDQTDGGDLAKPFALFLNQITNCHQLGFNRITIQNEPSPECAGNFTSHQPTADDPNSRDAHEFFCARSLRGFRSTRSVVDNCHERFGHARRILMLDDIAPVDDPGRALLNKCFGALEDFLIGRLTAAANQHRYACGNFNDFVI